LRYVTRSAFWVPFEAVDVVDHELLVRPKVASDSLRVGASTGHRHRAICGKGVFTFDAGRTATLILVD
jgi:hypothetical protein